VPADAQLKKKIEELLKAEFPSETVDVSDGYKDNIHVVVVSRRFDDMREKEKLDAVWQIIDSGDLTHAEKALISLIVPYSPRELK
jgi:acid stress-induced BolA-like protein IbaG/YrbA